MSGEKSFKTFHNNFDYYDRTGMEEYLEQKASEGWRLVKKQFAGEWEFKKTEPQKLHYTITYLPQFSNEDSFLLSENKNEYLELCAASGWQFVCAYKNMVIFLNEEENPLPLETDPEVELSSIHKAFLKSSLPKTIISFGVFAITFFYLLFSGKSFKGDDFVLGLLAFLSFYIAIDLLGYFRWRKKALAAAATGRFSKTNSPDRFLSGLFIVFSLLCAAAVIIKSIITGNWATFIIAAVIGVALVLDSFLDKIVIAEKNWKKYLVRFVSFLNFFAATALLHFVLDLF